MHARPPRRRIAPATPALLVAALLAVCFSATAIASAGPSTVPPTKPKLNIKIHAALTGTWSGQYSGAFNGTFTLKWKQVRSRLVGSITLSNPGGTYSINGSVRRNAIKFGAVGAGATYKGKVKTSTSMAGSYSTAQGGGSWSATKS
jgi:hypothetical protein